MRSLIIIVVQDSLLVFLTRNLRKILVNGGASGELREKISPGKSQFKHP